MLKDEARGDFPGNHWIFIIAILTGVVFFVNYISYIYDITDTVANLFLIPIIIAAFLFQKKGLLYTIFVMLFYLVFVGYMSPSPGGLIDAGEHAIIMTGIALIITLLSIALHQSEKRYRLLFETSPAPVIVTDNSGMIVDLNENFRKIFGYEKELLYGRRIGELDFIRDECGDKAEIFTEGLCGIDTSDKPFIVNIEDNAGSIHTCRLFFSTLYDDEGNVDVRMAVFLDITENVLAEEKIRVSLREKEMLLREVHHRVKNNLQVIVSILKLQLNRTEDLQAKETLRDCQNRVYSMAMVHEKIYRSESLAVIDIKEYLENLSRDIIMEYTDSIRRVTLDISSECGPELDLDTIVPCALITNELLTNSLKYAFPDGRTGKITIGISGSGGMCRYLYKDDGIGISPDFDIETTKTLGMRIVKSLVRQLKGEIEVKNDAGTEIIITFPIKT